MHFPGRCAKTLARLAILCAGGMIYVGCTATASSPGRTATLNRGEATQRLTAAEVATRRVEARIQVDQYDLGLRRSAINAPGQTPDEIARQQAAAAALSREIRALRKQLKAQQREQRKWRAVLGR